MDCSLPMDEQERKVRYYFADNQLMCIAGQTIESRVCLECAVAGMADFIISGDRHLTDLKSFQGIRIVSPTCFRETFAG